MPSRRRRSVSSVSISNYATNCPKLHFDHRSILSRNPYFKSMSADGRTDKRAIHALRRNLMDGRDQPVCLSGDRQCSFITISYCYSLLNGPHKLLLLPQLPLGRVECSYEDDDDADNVTLNGQSPFNKVTAGRTDEQNGTGIIIINMAIKDTLQLRH